MSKYSVLTEEDLSQPIEDVKFGSGVSLKNDVEFHLCLDVKNSERLLSLQLFPCDGTSEGYIVKLDESLPRDYRLPRHFAVDIEVFDSYDNVYDMAVVAILTRQSCLEISKRESEGDKDTQLVFDLHISGFVTEGHINLSEVANLIAVDENNEGEDSEEE